MADLKSGSSEDDVKAATKPLEEQDIKVIAIAVGKEADPLELGHTTGDKKNVIETAKDDKANEVGEKIMDKIRGRFKCIDYLLKDVRISSISITQLVD